MGVHQSQHLSENKEKELDVNRFRWPRHRTKRKEENAVAINKEQTLCKVSGCCTGGKQDCTLQSALSVSNAENGSWEGATVSSKIERCLPKKKKKHNVSVLFRLQNKMKRNKYRTLANDICESGPDRICQEVTEHISEEYWECLKSQSEKVSSLNKRCSQLQSQLENTEEKQLFDNIDNGSSQVKFECIHAQISIEELKDLVQEMSRRLNSVLYNEQKAAKSDEKNENIVRAELSGNCIPIQHSYQSLEADMRLDFENSIPYTPEDDVADDHLVMRELKLATEFADTDVASETTKSEEETVFHVYHTTKKDTDFKISLLKETCKSRDEVKNDFSLQKNPETKDHSASKPLQKENECVNSSHDVTELGVKVGDKISLWKYESQNSLSSAGICSACGMSLELSTDSFYQSDMSVESCCRSCSKETDNMYDCIKMESVESENCLLKEDEARFADIAFRPKPCMAVNSDNDNTLSEIIQDSCETIIPLSTNKVHIKPDANKLPNMLDTSTQTESFLLCSDPCSTTVYKDAAVAMVQEDEIPDNNVSSQNCSIGLKDLDAETSSLKLTSIPDESTAKNPVVHKYSETKGCSSVDSVVTSEENAPESDVHVFNSSEQEICKKYSSEEETTKEGKRETAEIGDEAKPFILMKKVDHSIQSEELTGNSHHTSEDSENGSKIHGHTNTGHSTLPVPYRNFNIIEAEFGCTNPVSCLEHGSEGLHNDEDEDGDDKSYSCSFSKLCSCVVTLLRRLSEIHRSQMCWVRPRRVSNWYREQLRHLLIFQEQILSELEKINNLGLKCYHLFKPERNEYAKDMINDSIQDHADGSQPFRGFVIWCLFLSKDHQQLSPKKKGSFFEDAKQWQVHLFSLCCQSDDIQEHCERKQSVKPCQQLDFYAEECNPAHLDVKIAEQGQHSIKNLFNKECFDILSRSCLNLPEQNTGVLQLPVLKVKKTEIKKEERLVSAYDPEAKEMLPSTSHMEERSTEQQESHKMLIDYSQKYRVSYYPEIVVRNCVQQMKAITDVKQIRHDDMKSGNTAASSSCLNRNRIENETCNRDARLRDTTCSSDTDLCPIVGPVQEQDKSGMQNGRQIVNAEGTTAFQKYARHSAHCRGKQLSTCVKIHQRRHRHKRDCKGKMFERCSYHNLSNASRKGRQYHCYSKNDIWKSLNVNLTSNTRDIHRPVDENHVRQAITKEANKLQKMRQRRLNHVVRQLTSEWFKPPSTHYFINPLNPHDDPQTNATSNSSAAEGISPDPSLPNSSSSSSAASDVLKREPPQTVASSSPEQKSSESAVEPRQVLERGLESYFESLSVGTEASAEEQMTVEWLRLRSFSSYYGEGSAHRLAKNGFYFVNGSGTETRCYSCGLVVSDWKYFDNIEERHRKQSPMCHLLQNEDSSNVPINSAGFSGNACQQQGSSRTSEGAVGFTIETESKPTSLPEKQTEVLRRSSEFAGGTSYQPVEDAENQQYPTLPRARTDFSGPPVSAQIRPPTTLASSQSTEPMPATSLRAEQASAACEDIRHPDFAALSVRMSSFSGWPSYLDQTPRQMAEAGFYYAGVADFARCFCCNGGLRNWEPGDDPLLEHTRWYPRCEYILKLKGERFIQTIMKKQNEHLARRQQQEQQQQQQQQQQRLQQAAQGARTGSESQRQPETTSLLEMGYTVDRVRQAVIAMRQRSGNTEVTAEQVLMFILDEEDRGLSEPPRRPGSGQPNQTSRNQTQATTTAAGTIGTATTSSSQQTSAVARSSPPNTRTNSNTRASSARTTTTSTTTTTTAGSAAGKQGTTSTSTASTNNQSQKGNQAGLKGGAQQGKKNGKQGKKSGGAPSNPSQAHNRLQGNAPEGASSVVELDPQSLKEENKKLKEMQLCKVCLDKPVGVTFLPCGHLVCCETCAPHLKHCPICRVRIKGTIKTYMS